MRLLSDVELDLISGGYSSSDPPPEDDVVVTARRQQGGTWTGTAGSGGSSGGTGNPDPTPPDPDNIPDCEAITTDTSHHTGDLSDAAKLAVAKVNEQHANALNQLSSRAGDTRISVGTMSFDLREIYELLSKADYEIYDSTATFNNDNPGSYTGGGGAVRGDGDPTLQVKESTIVNRGLSSPDAAVFYVLHEIVHTSEQFWNGRPDANASSAVKDAYEQATNEAARALATAIGIDLHNYQPPLGYPATQRATTQQGNGAAAGSTPVCG